MARLESLVLAALALIGASAAYFASDFNDGTAHGGDLVPVISGGACAILASAALFVSLRQQQEASPVSWRPWGVLIATVAFLALMPVIGYPIAAPVWVAGIMTLIGARNPVTIVATSAMLSLTAYLLLAKLAFAPPPMGPFGG